MTTQEKVQQWIENGEDFNEGVSLLSQIGLNKGMVKNLRNPKVHSGKLKNELLKAAKILNLKAVKSEITEADPSAVENPKQKAAAEKPDTEVPDKREDWREKPSAAASKNETYPAEVEKVKSEYSRLYNLRAQLHGQMTDVTPDNAPGNVKKRKVLSDSIAEISQRLELLHAAKELYFENGTIPDIDALFGEVKKAEQAAEELPDDIKKLKAMKKALQINVHKAKNKLEYQEETKQKRANPMPAGPKRLDLEKTIEEREKEIERIEFKIVELAHTH